ncbi:MAG: hypothetical protein AMXMBFR64_33100 [Myxococcales bacterium]
MGKVYKAGELAELPRASALDLEAIGVATLTSAKATAGFPASAAKSLARLEAALSALSAMIAELVTPKKGTLGPVPHLADRRLDRVLSLMRQWTEAHLFLDEPENPGQAHAQAIHDVFFADGLSYVNLPYKRQWSSVKARMTVADQQGLAAHFEALHGGFFLDSLRRLHAVYGDALGITDAMVATDVEARLAPLAAEVRTELKRYVEKVVASVEPDEPETIEVMNTLLLPLTTHNPAGAAAPADAAPEPPAEAPAPA